jgi:hypothetical protein
MFLRGRVKKVEKVLPEQDADDVTLKVATNIEKETETNPQDDKKLEQEEVSKKK